TVDPVTSKTTVITGTGEAGSTVTVASYTDMTVPGTRNVEVPEDDEVTDTVDIKEGITNKVP
ncbi:hypothetical protein, partial [Staphylococcus felis]|uniref:hypothetical protein n=1 Tax=Staphylococcus felis TaxID=46127 RepID=UPI000E39D1C7